jgi:hypothetical protein
MLFVDGAQLLQLSDSPLTHLVLEGLCHCRPILVLRKIFDVI